jgi:hypothetical protein
MYLEMKCNDCAISKYCPSRGISPIMLSNKKTALCRLVGGYGKTPVDPDILSEESRMRMSENGSCLTIAEIPVVHESDYVYTVIKIFHPAVLHEREKTNVVLDSIITKNSNIDKF